MSFFENRLLLCLSALQGGFFWSGQPGGPDMSYERRMIYGHARHDGYGPGWRGGLILYKFLRFTPLYCFDFPPRGGVP